MCYISSSGVVRPPLVGMWTHCGGKRGSFVSARACAVVSGTAQGLLCCVAFQTFRRFKCQSCSLVGHNVPGRYSAVLVNFSVRHGKRKREERSSTSTRPQQFLLFQRPRGPGQQWLPMCDEVFNENSSNIRNHVIRHQI